MKKMKMAAWVVGLAAVMAGVMVSCGIEEIGGVPEGESGEVWVRPGMNEVTGTDKGKVVTYITALDYRDGYDWRADREKGSVKCSLVVYRDGVPVMKLPVGDRYGVSSDTDMHRMVGGHLYTDYSTGSETVIKRDGAEIMRYTGREMICGLAEKEGDVYTLGHNRDGEGFAYRRNGEIIVGRSQGRTFGSLVHDGDSLCFAFHEPIEADGVELERYYHVVNGVVSQAAVREDVKKVWDIVSYRGKLHYLASVVGISSPVLFGPEGMKALKMPAASEMLTCRIVRQEDVLCIEGIYKRNKKPLTSGLWDETGQLHVFADGMTVSSICYGGGGICCALNGPSSSKNGQIYRCGEILPMPSGYSAIGPSSIIMIDGILHVGLSSHTGAQPLIWRDGETTPLKINGFISGISTDKKR